MVADSITDSEIFHGSPISRDFTKKRKANWFGKLKKWKIDARRRQWIYQSKRTNASDEENGRRLKSFLDKLTDRKDWRVDHEEGSYNTKWNYDDEDDEICIERSSSSTSGPTSVLKSKDSISEDCICCSHQITEEEEEEVFDDAYEHWEDFSDALPCFENDDNEILQLETVDLEQEEDPTPNSSQRKKKPSPIHKDIQCQPDTSPATTIHRNIQKKKRSGKQEGDDEKHTCPICAGEMDATDLSFNPCPCGFRLCLFCHKQINENDERCPACRKKYAQTNSNRGGVYIQQRDGGKLRLSPSRRS